MDNKTTLIYLFLSFFLYSCEPNDTREGVHKSKVWVKHFQEEYSSDYQKCYYHYIYIGNYIVKSQKDTTFLIGSVMKYLDTVKIGKPLGGVVFMNNIEGIAQVSDDQDAGKIRKNTIFNVSFKKDSLRKNKYVISYYSLWKDGKPVKSD